MVRYGVGDTEIATADRHTPQHDQRLEARQGKYLPRAAVVGGTVVASHR